MNKFHIMITDNETGEILLCDNFDGILGAGVSNDEDEVRAFEYTECNTMSLISAALAARVAAHEAIEYLPRKLRRKVRRFNCAKYIKNKKGE